MRHQTLSILLPPILLPLATALAACGSAGAGNGAAAANDAAPADATGPASDANAASAAAPGGPTATWHLPMRAAQLTAAERDAILEAAGYDRRGNGWDASGEPANSEFSCPAGIEDGSFDNGPAIRDLNGDGRPEVITTSSGTYCYGMTGQAFAILTPTATGWRTVFEETGIPTFRPRAGSTWPDIVIGGPGFCFPKVRWNGSAYVPAGRDDGEGHACTLPGEEAPPPAVGRSEQSARPVPPLGLAAGYYVEEASPCNRPDGMVYYYGGQTYSVRYQYSETSVESIGKPVFSNGRWDMDDGSIIEVLSPTRMRLTVEEPGPPMRLCPTDQIPANLRVR
jgi:hypothetical protein